MVAHDRNAQLDQMQCPPPFEACKRITTCSLWQSYNGDCCRFPRNIVFERLELFGSAARGEGRPDSDVDLLVTLDESLPVSTGDLLEMAGEAEELVGASVDFVLRPSLERSPNPFAREHILSTAVCVCGIWPTRAIAGHRCRHIESLQR